MPTKRDCWAKAAPALAAMVRTREAALHPCPSCGRPTVAELCSVCENTGEAA